MTLLKTHGPVDSEAVMSHAVTINAETKQLSRLELLMQQSNSANDLAFRVHTQASSQSRRLQSYIAQKYFQVHQAHLTEFMPQLIEMYQGACIYGGVGLKPGNAGDFLLEQYLDQPIENVIAGLANSPISRASIVEIGNLAVVKRGMGSLLITVVAKSLQQAGFRWMVFTATEEVERLVSRLGCAPIVLAEANPERLSPSSNLWGDYYKARPKVVACDLRKTISAANENRFLAKLFDQYIDSTVGLSQVLKSRAVSTIN